MKREVRFFVVAFACLFGVTGLIMLGMYLLTRSEADNAKPILGIVGAVVTVACIALILVVVRDTIASGVQTGLRNRERELDGR